MRHRVYHVSHSRDGFALQATDEFTPATVVDNLTNGVMTLLGHPCCGRGPLGWVPFDWFRIGLHHWINLGSPLHRHDRDVLRLPLTREQALTLQPDWAEQTWTEDGTVDRGEPATAPE